MISELTGLTGSAFVVAALVLGLLGAILVVAGLVALFRARPLGFAGPQYFGRRFFVDIQKMEVFRFRRSPSCRRKSFVF